MNNVTVYLPKLHQGVGAPIKRFLEFASDSGMSVHVIDSNSTPAIRVDYKWWSGDMDLAIEEATRYIRSSMDYQRRSGTGE
jgi:hypothetical protein